MTEDEAARRAKREAKLASPKLADRGDPTRPLAPGWKDLKTVEAQEKEYGAIRPRLVVVGDSLAKNWPWKDLERLGLEPVATLAVSGYLVQNVLWRIENSAIDMSNAQAVLLLAGTNNLSVADPVKEIAKGLRLAGRLLAKKAPQATVYILHPPQRRARGEKMEAKRLRLGEKIDAVAAEEGFVAVAAPQIDPALYRDATHLAPAGYTPLTDAVRAALRRPEG